MMPTCPDCRCPLLPWEAARYEGRCESCFWEREREEYVTDEAIERALDIITAEEHQTPVGYGDPTRLRVVK